MKLLESIKRFKMKGLVFILLFGFMPSLWAKPVALVSAIKGGVFYSYQGVTKSLSLGMHIPSGAEVFGEVGSQVTITDYYDHRYHMASSGHIRIEDNLITLLSGYVWIQSWQSSLEAKVKTANAVVGYLKGDGIVSFDSIAGKTQLLVIDGDFSLANALNPELRTSVYDGQFSFISTDNEAPRAPTFCGFGSFKKVVALFGGVKPMSSGAMDRMRRSGALATNMNFKQHTAPVENSRSIASVATTANSRIKKQGRIILRLSHEAITKRAPASVGEDDRYIAEFYQKELSKIKKIRTKPFAGRKIANKQNQVIIKIFDGQQIKERALPKKMKHWSPTVKKVKLIRGPASVKSVNEPPAIEDLEKSLYKQLKKQTRHPSEVNKLIDELNSYQQDFEKSY